MEQGGTQAFFLYIKKLAGPSAGGHKYELNKKLYTKKEFEAFPIKSNGNLGKWNYIIYAGKNDKKIF